MNTKLPTADAPTTDSRRTTATARATRAALADPALEGLPRRLPVKDAARMLSISPSALYGWIAAGVMPALYQFAPRCSGFELGEFVEWMRSRPTGVATGQTDKATLAAIASPKHASKVGRRIDRAIAA